MPNWKNSGKIYQKQDFSKALKLAREELCMTEDQVNQLPNKKESR